MKIKSRKVRPVNSLICISDRDGGEPPEPIWGAWILSTSSCITIGCYPEQDGSTLLILGSAQDIDPGYASCFDGMLETPHCEVLISTVVYKTLLQAKVPSPQTRVRIWANQLRTPDKVLVGLC